jgi:GMP synthase (glutamine-hydrolysing)
MSRLLVLQHLEREGPGLFVKLAEERGFTVCIFRLDLGDSLPEFKNGDLLLVLGGPMGIRDIGTSTYPWLIEEVDLIKEALNRRVGLIGVCLGAQLLAYSAGGDVEILQDEVSLKPFAEIGWDNIFPQPSKNNCKLRTLLGRPFPVLHWHGDRILLPNTAELIAGSCRCKEQLFRIGTLAFGLQFHVEVDDEMVNTWISEDQKFISSALGVDGQSILKQQQKDFGHKTLDSRLEFLNILFDLLRK